MSLIPFVYRDYYDSPHAILISYRDHLWFLDNRFDEALDDYAPDFHVYLLPEKYRGLMEPMVPGVQGSSWLMLPADGRELGTFPTAELVLDRTNRRFLDARVLDRFLDQL